ncbi:16S rRNA (guanine(966)-N(2))-methyltransferase RsmD [Temperatibacter marinus]|uniref:16S rRNA (Guanine(966)-N(2))-methyltransferase RsmD n=1 Tax=Temperatibacter marinus TaxID=1456591 RepID=A0AA52EB64_9PROT|nr:16S rRNA (guanine(966)-N(2))-methyltransferase RsmD [Temperatibacter marinus]WND01515.1 16S rRNA (guanine(966)-N(2))-methyltransferase RsmD [Temperatibacter marinus]
MLRLISGKYKGRKLAVPEGLGVRPTTDRMRERIFSMLAHPRYPELYQARVADLFAGTGALGLEALSRGAAFVTFVEKSGKHTENLSQNISLLEANQVTSVLKTSATSLPKATAPYDLIFMDPPYNQGLAVPALYSAEESGWISEKTLIVMEVASGEMPEIDDRFSIVDDRKQGKQKILFIQVAS